MTNHLNPVPMLRMSGAIPPSLKCLDGVVSKTFAFTFL
jgi:hypothetical protein